MKRNDSPGSTSEFGGFVAAPGGAVLTAPAARSRQVEFIGDSLTVGYGNTSTSRDCTGDQVSRTTDTDISYGALTARQLSADYQINAISGRGMVRNVNGTDPGTETTIVAVGAGSFADYVQQVVRQRAGAGDSRVRYWFLDNSGLDFSGCQWHYSTHDDRVIADRLSAFIGSLPRGW